MQNCDPDRSWAGMENPWGSWKPTSVRISLMPRLGAPWIQWTGSTLDVPSMACIVRSFPAELLFHHNDAPHIHVAGTVIVVGSWFLEAMREGRTRMDHHIYLQLRLPADR